jgi:hypothetical protein
MSPETVFQLANGAAPVAWLFMILAPRSRVVRSAILNGACVAVLAALYLLVVVAHFNMEGADFTSLAGVTALLSDPWAMTAGWIHYLAFDLLAGIIITKKGLGLGMHRVLLLPCQLATFMLGPVGIMLFVAVAISRGARWSDLALGTP